MRTTQSAFIELHPAGCVIVRCKEVKQTLEHARENVTTSIEVSGGKKRHPLLVDISNVAPLESDVRHYYVGGALADNFTALGLVVEASPLGRMMGNVFFRMMDAVYRRNASSGIPTRLFRDEDSAIAWLTTQGR